ncbi:MAG: transcriptional repressor [Pseudomonadota bacterium]
MARRSVASATIAPKWRKIAETRCAEQGERLTPARLSAYAELLASKRALSAYELMAHMERRQKKKIAPLTVYRHLDFLIRVGLVHRLESTQSYFACDHPQHSHESQYLLCSECGQIDEIDSSQIGKILGQIAGQKGFQPARAIVEVAGLCQDCATNESD